MSIRNPDTQVLLGRLEWSAFTELNDVSDYIYKAPRLLASEKELEKRKLAMYFPQGGSTADLRNHYESLKLNETFPRLIAMSNLFLVLSVFENYVFRLLTILQDQSQSALTPLMSRGVADHLKAMKAYGAEPYDAKHYEQVLVAISIRNCLMHAKGALATYRHAEALRTQIGDYKFLSPDLRSKRSNQARLSINDEVSIEVTGSDEQLLITNGYSHLACSYLRDYFCALCGTLNPNIPLRPTAHDIDPLVLCPEKTHREPIM